MGRLCFFAVLLLLRQAESVKWEFGDDNKSLFEIIQLSGRVKPMEKIKHLQVTQDPCMDIKYVVVEVFNDHSTPIITYSASTREVVISYTKIQKSASRYDVTVKGNKKRKCS